MTPASSKPSAITIGAAALAAVVLAAAGVFVAGRWWWRAADGGARAADNLDEAPVVAAGPAPAAGGGDVPAAVERAAPAGAIDGGAAGPAGEGTVAAVEKRGLLRFTQRERMIQEADERAFEALALPEETRAAIRRINEEQGARARLLLGPSGPPRRTADEALGAAIAGADDAERSRRAAIATAVGADVARDLRTAEYSALRRLRQRYGRRWAEALDDEAPLPPGLPPSPH